MPSMYDIYDRHALEYDQLVEHEDYRSNLRTVLRDTIRPGATVIEAGIGTGRVTGLYVDLAAKVFGFDRSANMLEQATRNLAPWSGRLELANADHRQLPIPADSGDVFVEGWAFGHVAVDHPDDVPRITRELVAEADRVTRRTGTIILIESLGTNVDSPAPPDPALGEFFELLETNYRFVRRVISTDYLFESSEQAESLCRFFFGDALADSVKTRLSQTPGALGHGSQHNGGAASVPEFTGVWTRI